MSITIIIFLVAFVNAFISLFTKQTNNFYCGIIGFSAPKRIKFDKEKLQTLFFINSLLRGKDSVGLYSPINGLQKVGKDYHTVATEENNIFDNLQKDNVLIGHVRAKTYGANVVANAHPWEFNNIVGLHNGTLDDFYSKDYSLAKKYSIGINDWDVDSQVLLKALDKDFDSLEETLLPALEGYEGAAALLMYHKHRETIFACHDEKRPLFYGYIGKAMYISSIMHTLAIIGCKDIQEFEVNFVHEIKDGQIINKFGYTPESKIVKPTKILYSGSKTFKEFLDESSAVSASFLKGLFQLDNEGKLIGSSKYPAAGSAHTGVFGLVDFEPDLFHEFNFRLRAKSEIETINTLGTDSKKVVLDGSSDYFKLLGKTGQFGSHVKIMDVHSKKVMEIPSHLIDISRFIPVKDKYVKVINDISFTNTGIMFAFMNDIAKVIAFHPKTGNYTVATLDGTTASISPECIVCATAEEVLHEALLRNDTALVNAIQGIKVEEVVEEPLALGEDSCVVLRDPTEIINDDDDDSLFDSTTAMIDCDKLDDFIETVRDTVDMVDDMIDEGEEMSSIKSGVEQIKQYISNYNFSEIIIK